MFPIYSDSIDDIVVVGRVGDKSSLEGATSELDWMTLQDGRYVDAAASHFSSDQGHVIRAEFGHVSVGDGGVDDTMVVYGNAHPSQGTQSRNGSGSLLDAVKEGASGQAGIGAGYHLKDFKIGPLKAGGGVVFGSGGVGADSEGPFVWGESTLDVQLSAGRYGGRAYLWDVDIGSRGVENIDVFGVESPTWDWSIGVGGTWTPYSFEAEYDFQPLIDYFKPE